MSKKKLTFGIRQLAQFNSLQHSRVFTHITIWSVIALLTIALKLMTEPRWNYVAQTEDDTRVYVNRESVERRNELVHFWSLQIYASSKANGAVRAKGWGFADCRTGEYYLRKVVDTDSTGKIVNVADAGEYPKLVYAPPGSAAAALVKQACLL